MIDYALILSTYYLDKQWSLDGNSYDGLDWLDSSPKPTKEELDALAQAAQTQVAKNACKATAKAKLAASDWASLADVDLANKADFVSYRAVLRGFVINPVVNPVFPDEPQAVWA